MITENMLLSLFLGNLRENFLSSIEMGTTPVVPLVIEP
jgi:hypothetical protein